MPNDAVAVATALNLLFKWSDEPTNDARERVKDQMMELMGRFSEERADPSEGRRQG